MTARPTAQRDRDRAAIRRSKAPCGICQQPIDYALPHLHPRSFVVDHVVPLALGAADTLDNKQAAHRQCNRDKGARPHYAPALARQYVTSRTW